MFVSSRGDLLVKNHWVLLLLLPLAIMLSACNEENKTQDPPPKASASTKSDQEKTHDHDADHAEKNATHTEHDHAHENHTDEKHDHEHENHDHAGDTKDTYSVHEDHDSHEHGVATLNVTLNESRVEVMLESPAANIFGFEHKASTDEDKQTLQSKKVLLENADQLLIFNKEAECKQISGNIDSPLFDQEPEKNGDAHNDVYASWVFECQNKTIESVETQLFSKFPQGFERINVEWISLNNASAVTLSKDGMVIFN